MSPGLGFASTIGAFIGGAARQANENMIALRQAETNDEKIWAAQFSKSQEQYEKEKKDYTKKAETYKSFLEVTGGNHQAAKHAMAAWESDPRSYREIYEGLKGAKQGNPEGYVPSYLSSAQNDVLSRYRGLQQMRDAGTRGGALKKYFPMPNPPDFGMSALQGDYSAPQPPVEYFNNPSRNTNMPIGTKPTPSGPNNPQYKAGIDTNPMSTTFEFPQANTVGSPTPLIPPGQTTPTPGPESMAQASPGQSNFPTYIPRQGLIKTPHQLATEEQAKKNYELERQKWDYQKAQKPETFLQQKNIETGNTLFKEYLHDDKVGLNRRYQTAIDSQALRYDVNSMAELINKGLMAGKGQDVLDELNRFTAPFLGLDLSNPMLGLSNKISDVQLLKKDIANAMIDKLRTLHFGRITNYTESIVKQGMPSNTNDPDTNIRIVLALQDTIASGLKVAQIERSIVNDPKNQEAIRNGTKTFYDIMQEARRAADTYTDEYMKQREPFPILDDPRKAAQLQEGSWYEYKHDHRMYRYLGTENGMMKFQNAGTKTGGKPEIFQIPVQ